MIFDLLTKDVIELIIYSFLSLGFLFIRYLITGFSTSDNFSPSKKFQNLDSN